MKKVKYKVTHAFGLREEGTILDAILVAEDEDVDTVLLFHPARKGECPSFEICVKNIDGVYTSYAEDCYVNVSKNARKITKLFLESE